MRFAAIAIVVVGVAGVLIYDRHDKSTNYQRVDARISGVSEQCYLEKVERGVITKTTWTSDLTRCEIAELLRKEHPKWQGYDLKHKIEVKVVYVSPVDGATHQSSLQMSYFPNGKPLRAGDVFPVLASKTKADKTRSI
ncbi:hypothetical protein [Bradyrhizobium elkanii]|uniref:hypothetical protein n=1 Tax=Bradyrhizobium elkanii TaxID=29448 RepID=UPI0008422CC3|nr:hypothetical protein [Bradyrhizobium elkanii]MCP1969328.1 hypothetical protein [Bradyrhizobium elkanii]MCS4109165.1 hypothetical protein [Bradyrhizobium elkanii]ODM77470.1 hypothetical protein A6452_32705 [Bradyrhizobium elkanii]ODM82076.1 hypothetical protein A6X20_20805 [Bradyrhizobium elkanii]